MSLLGPSAPLVEARAVPQMKMARRPFWLSGTHSAMKFGALMLRFSVTPGLLAENASTVPSVYRRSATTTFARVSNSAMWVPSSTVYTAGWDVVAFSGETANSGYPLTPFVTVQSPTTVVGGTSQPQTPWMTGPEITRQWTWPVCGGSVFGMLQGADVSLQHDCGDAPIGGSVTIRAHGGGTAAAFLDTTRANIKRTGRVRFESTENTWNMGNNHVGHYSVAAGKGNWSPLVTEVGDPSHPSYAYFHNVTGLIINLGGLARPEVATWRPATRFAFGVDREAQASDQRFGTATLQLPVGSGSAWAPVGFVQGASHALKHYAERDGRRFLSYVWNANEVMSLLTTVLESAPAEAKASVTNMRNYFATNGGKALRALAWDRPTKWSDIYTDSVIAEALKAGMSISDINDHEVAGRKLSDWKRICGDAAPSAIWVGLVDASNEPPHAILTGVVQTPGRIASWLLPPEVQGQHVFVDPEAVMLYGNYKLASRNPGGTHAAALLADLQKELDDRGKGEVAVGQDNSQAGMGLFTRFKPNLVISDPWLRLGDVWFQHHLNKSVSDLVSSLVQTELEPFKQEVFL